jgi:glycosyltransferase involved in cell wall biosynthesis
MKIILSSDIFELQRFGGVSRYFVKLAEELQTTNLCDILVATKFHLNGYLKDSSANSGVYLPFSPSQFGLENMLIRLNKLHARKLSSNQSFDVLHETFYRGNADSILAKTRVTTVHDLIREKFSPKWSGRDAKSKAINRADAIICVSKTTASELGDYYAVEDSRIHVIPHGVDSSFFNEDESLVRQKSHNSLLYVGSRSEYKSFKTLVDAFANSLFLRGNFNVNVVGQYWAREEEDYMREKNVQGCFRYIGMSEKSLRRAYQDSIALVVTSTYEGFGMTVLEGMASRCVVFSTRAGALREISGGLDVAFEAKNSDSLAESLERTLSDSALVNSLQRDAYSYAAQFSWKATAERTSELYKSLS